MRWIAAIVLLPPLVAITSARADVSLPADIFWFSCTGFGVRVVNGTMSEVTPDTEPQRAIYAVSIGAKSLWWYYEPDHTLVAYDATDITSDKINGRQAHSRPAYTLTSQLSFDRKTLSYTSDADAAYPDGIKARAATAHAPRWSRNRFRI